MLNSIFLFNSNMLCELCVSFPSKTFTASPRIYPAKSTSHCLCAPACYNPPMAKNSPSSLLSTLRLIALAATLLASGPLISSLLFYKNALLTGGIVLEFAPNDAIFEPDTTPVIAFVDYRRQKYIAVPDSAFGADNVLLGQRLRLKYDPVNPENFRLDTPLGMWGRSVIRLLYGLVPFLILSVLLAGKGKRAPVQAPPRTRSQSIKPEHLIRHKNAPPRESGVVRRMR